MENYSLSDIASVSGGNGFGGNNSWVLILLFAMIFGGGGFGFGGAGAAATSADVQRATDFSAIERQMNEGVAATRQGVYDVTGSIKDGNYNILGEMRDIQSATNTGFASVAAGFADMQKCCCEINRNIDSVNYNAAINTASINANTVAQTQKILDALSANRMADMQNQINQLQMQNAMAGVVRYPMQSTYSIGMNPYCASNSCC